MSDELIARARAALDGVTPGPWEWDEDIDSETQWLINSDGDCILWWDFDCGLRFDNEAVRDFIAAARQLVPEMADELTRLRAEVERLRDAERTAWERGRDAAADECDRLRASYDRSARGYDEDDPLRGRIKYSGAAVAVASANIRDLSPEASHD